MHNQPLFLSRKSGLCASIKVHSPLIPFRQLPRKQPSKVTVLFFASALMGIPKSAVEQLLRESEDHACREAPEICVKVMAIANLPTLYGDYQAVAFWNNFDKKEHAAFVHGDIFEKECTPSVLLAMLLARSGAIAGSSFRSPSLE